jgi:heterodisulfide reductase subunit A
MPASASPAKIGVFFSHADTGRLDGLEIDRIMAYALDLPGVILVEDLGPGARPEAGALAATIRERELAAVVIAGDMPGSHKPVFARAMFLAGGDPEAVRLASFGEVGAATGDPEAAARSAVVCAVHGVPYGLAMTPARVPVHPDTLVIGAGVAGIETALRIADAGHKVHLVERAATIGGHMAMFDKTFPTLDCAACILTPKMVAAGQHENIDILNCSEVQAVHGEPGEYKVRVLRRARRVDPEACVACHACRDACPVRVPSEFDEGIVERKAIYMSFPQAIPNSYVIDAENCLWVQSEGRKCGACVKKCPKDAIHLDEEPRSVELTVGNIVVATGFDTFDAELIDRYGYGVLPNVLTALEFERLTNASGPTGGRIVTRTVQRKRKTREEQWVFDTDAPAPRSVAIIHCVGSRDQNHNPYCSRVCCMYSLKFAHLVKEKLPDAECYQFYIDMRAYGKGYEEFFERIKDEGVFVVRGRTARVEASPAGGMIIRGEDVVHDRIREFPVDMVLLAVGLEPARGTGRLARVLDIRPGPDGWFTELNYNTDPTATNRGGIHVAGVCQGPKDIPDTVAQASAVAARVLGSVISGSIRVDRDTITPDEAAASAARLAGIRTQEEPWPSEPTPT